MLCACVCVCVCEREREGGREECMWTNVYVLGVSVLGHTCEQCAFAGFCVSEAGWYSRYIQPQDKPALCQTNAAHLPERDSTDVRGFSLFSLLFTPAFPLSPSLFFHSISILHSPYPPPPSLSFFLHLQLLEFFYFPFLFPNLSLSLSLSPHSSGSDPSDLTAACVDVLMLMCCPPFHLSTSLCNGFVCTVVDTSCGYTHTKARLTCSVVESRPPSQALSPALWHMVSTATI